MWLAGVALIARQPNRPAGQVESLAALVPQFAQAAGFAVSPPVSAFAEQAPLSSDASLLTPLPTLSFDGLSNQDNYNTGVIGGSRPDTTGDVGPNHYVQAVNVVVRIYNKSGVPLTAPFKMSTLFNSVGGVCSTQNHIEPVVLYDPLANRWLLSQWAFNTFAPYHQCIAISTTGDPTGSYFLYDFISPNSNFNDHVRFSVWADAYYMSSDQFRNQTSFSGFSAFAFDRAKMLAGDPTANFVSFSLGASVHSMLPADLDGSTPPPPGAPVYFAALSADEFGDAGDAIRLFAFHADFADPAASTFSELPESPLPVAAFDPLAPAGARVIEQPPPATSLSYLDAVQDRLMYRLAYRNFGGTRESLVVTHTVNVGFDFTTTTAHQAGIRYYELRRSLLGGLFSVAEQASFAPDTDNRWMGSAAMDGQGNIAVGYSVSSLTTFPSIRYAGRLFSDPPNGLFQGEGVLVAGSDVQRTTTGVWGNRSALSVDPADDCTFWYTNEYYKPTGSIGSNDDWSTRIGTFRFPNCGSQGPRGTIAGQVTDVATGSPVPGAVLGFIPGTSAVVADANGNYAATVPPGTYSVTASVRNHPYQSVFGVVVTNGGTATVNFALTLPPVAGVLAGRVRNATTNAPIANAVVWAGGVTSTTDASGLYTLNLPVGTYTLIVSAASYFDSFISGVVIANQVVTTRDVGLSLRSGTGFLTGHVRSAATNAAIANAVVSVGTSSTITNAAGVYSFYLPVATYRITVSANEYLDTNVSSVALSDQATTTRDVLLQPVAFTQAAYDATLKAPQCGNPGAACDSGTLLVGRDSIVGGAEPNQPNTILNSCADGIVGTFHEQKSLDRIRVYTLDDGAFASGKTVRIEATVWASSLLDALDLYVAADASSPSWTLLKTLTPPAVGAQTLSTTFVLSAGALQAVRGNYRDSGASGICTTGSADDRDDLIFATSTVAGQVTDALTGFPIAGASVSISPGGAMALTDANGFYGAALATGTYTLTASSSLHLSQSAAGVSISSGSTTTVNFSLSLAPTTGVVSGHVRDAATNAPIANAVVSAGAANSPGVTDATGFYALFLPSGTHALTAVATDYVSTATSGVVVSGQTNATVDFLLASTLATYDPALKAPRCSQDTGLCDSGALLVGRATTGVGVEPNQPNAILNSCVDSNFGGFHYNESADRIKIFTLDGGPFAPGKVVKVEVTVWVSNPINDLLEIYLAPAALSPAWLFADILVPSVQSGPETLSTTFVLPAGTLQAVRARFYDQTWSRVGTPCVLPSGLYDDVDDLIFNVDPAPAPPAIVAQPTDQTVTTGSTATFAAGFIGSPAPSYQWQVSTDGGTSWTNLTNAAPYGGVTTAALTISSAPFSLNGYRYRVIGTNGLGSTTSDATTLVVIPFLTITTIGGSSNPAFYYPFGVAVDSSGNVFVADNNNHTIRKITPAGVVTTLAGLTGVLGNVDGTGSAARFNYPRAIAVDAAGTLYVADSQNRSIRKITPVGVVTTLAGGFSDPRSVAVDPAGTVYVADANMIRKVTAGGAVTTLAGSTSSGSADGTGTAARFSVPYGVAVDAAGTVYVADTFNNTIRKITPSGVVTTFVGSPIYGGSADGVGGSARFGSPTSVAVDAAGTLYVTDSANGTIRRITPAGAVVTVAGSAGLQGSVDGTGPAARFSTAYGIAVDSAGNIYVADTNNHKIRKGMPSASGNLVFANNGLVAAPDPVERASGDLAASDPEIPSAVPQPEIDTTPAGAAPNQPAAGRPVTESVPTQVARDGTSLLTAVPGVVGADRLAPPRNRASGTVPVASDQRLEMSDAASPLVTTSIVQALATAPPLVRPDAPNRAAQIFSTVAVADRRWEVEFFGGGLLASRPAGGTAALPGAGDAFTTAQGNPSRRVSSWYFGDGASLLNQVNTAMGVSQQITPLDGFVGSAVAHRQNGRTLGVRVSRVLNFRLTAEVTIEFGPGVGISSGTLDRLESARATFLSAWNGLFSTAPFQNLSLTSTVTPTVVEARRQVFTTGAVNIALSPHYS
ncbi:MAG: hypothetical protein A3G76_10810 [Acidobacteria bacterium RIFCSPLOWO2_12_FULL_65_11]|nr:MAG: hypothetical protein A3H95_00270 [Acidobacteria bacterium RIFCSPLOWO2_02_FULL_64_15]OFW29691.1 MAG: hypothetical protein A3G76_10810 [Acidobacteria bacterium RIFCSPLOWO2_12_FULL_65_11]